MNIQSFRTMMLAGLLVSAGALSGCSSGGDFDDLGNPDGGGGGGNSSCAIDGTALCAIPTLGPEIVSGAGGTCTTDPGMLDPFALCAVPGVGVPLAEAICGVACPAPVPGAEPPLSLEQLCAIPTLGPQIVEGAGGTCPPPGPSPVPVPSPEELCAIPAPIGPGLAGALGATCP